MGHAIKRNTSNFNQLVSSYVTRAKHSCEFIYQLNCCVTRDRDRVASHGSRSRVTGHVTISSAVQPGKHKACLAQLVEYRFCKPTVIGSIPVAGLFFLEKSIQYLP